MITELEAIFLHKNLNGFDQVLFRGKELQLPTKTSTNKISLAQNYLMRFPLDSLQLAQNLFSQIILRQRTVNQLLSYIYVYNFFY